ncbi:MAG: tetratricopeptide repeat protein [Selenomonadaceae bacterium]|nr:tetratricopeptide repeat protein [Selenomonadaceae bacterium]
MKKMLLLTLSIVASMFGNVSAAELIQASGTYIMDSRLDETPASATARAREDAKRRAAQQAGVYVESYTKVANLMLEESEVQTIAASVLKIQDEKTSITVMEENLLKFTVEITALVDDTDPQVLQSMLANRESFDESVRRNIELQREYDALKQEMEDLKRQYESADANQREKIKIESAQNISRLNSLEDLEKANEFYVRQNYVSALEYYNHALEINPNSAEAYNNRGLTYYHLNQFTNALSDFSKAIDLDKNFSHAYNNRGMILNSMGQHSQAIPDFDQALKLNPKFSYALNNRGNAYAAIGKYQNAVQDLKSAAKISDNSAEIHNNLGNVYQATEKYSDAIKEYSKAIKLNANYFEAFYNRSIVYYMQKKYSEALSDARRAVELNPQDSDAKELFDSISREVR